MELEEFTPPAIRPPDGATVSEDGTEDPALAVPVTKVTNGYVCGLELGSEQMSQEESDLLEKLFQENHELKVQLSKISHDYELLRDAQMQLEAGTARLTREKDAEHNERMASLRQENYNLKGYLDEYEQKQKDLEAELMKARGQKRGSLDGGLTGGLVHALKDAHCNELKQATQVQDGRIRTLEGKVKTLERELEAAKARSGGEKERLERMVQKNAELEEELAHHKKYKMEVDGLKMRLAQTQERMECERERASVLEFQHKAMQERLAAEQERVRSLQEDKTNLQERLQLGNMSWEYEEDSDHEHSFSFGSLNGDELVRLQAENSSLQAKLNQKSLASEMEEANAVLIRELRSREAELVAQLCEKEAEIERMKSVEIFGTSYAAVFRRQSEVVEVVHLSDTPSPSQAQRSETGGAASPFMYSGPLLDLDPEMQSGDFASVTSMSITAESDDDEDYQKPDEQKLADSNDFDLEDDMEPLTPRPETGTSFANGTVFNSTPPPPPVIVPDTFSAPAPDHHACQAQLQKIHAAYEMEERLLSSAFYNYGLVLQREAAMTRNTPTWLDRQRYAKNTDFEYDKHKSVMPQPQIPQAASQTSQPFFRGSISRRSSPNSPDMIPLQTRRVYHRR